MRPVKEITLPYFDKGEEKEFYFDIKFVPNKVHEDIRKLQNDIWFVQKTMDEMQEYLFEINHLKKENKKKFKEKIKELEELSKEKEDKLKRIANKDFFERRFETILFILESNGIKIEELYERDFWNNCVDANIINQFLADVMQKDYVNKKKAVSE